MKFKKFAAPLLAGALAAVCAAIDLKAQQHDHSQASTQTKSQNTTGEAGGATLSLDDLERMALANNPTLAQAEAAVRAAEAAANKRDSGPTR